MILETYLRGADSKLDQGHAKAVHATSSVRTPEQAQSVDRSEASTIAKCAGKAEITQAVPVAPFAERVSCSAHV